MKDISNINNFIIGDAENRLLNGIGLNRLNELLLSHKVALVTWLGFENKVYSLLSLLSAKMDRTKSTVLTPF